MDAAALRRCSILATLVAATAPVLAQPAPDPDPAAPAADPDAHTPPPTAGSPAATDPYVAPPSDPDYLPSLPPPAPPAPSRPVVTSSPGFPAAYPDRPLVLPPGMTELDLSYEIRTSVATTGARAGERTAGYTPDINVAHAFGPVAVHLGLGQDAYGSLTFATHSIPEAVSIAASFSATQSDGSYSRSQSAAIRHKLFLLPHRFALVGSASLVLFERGMPDTPDMIVERQAIIAEGGLGAYVQLLPWLAATLGASGGVPLGQSAGYGLEPGLAANVGLVATFERWDFYANGSLGNLPRTPTTFSSMGFVKRWGN